MNVKEEQTANGLRFNADVDTHGASYTATFEYWPVANMAKVERTRPITLNADGTRQSVSATADPSKVDPGTRYQAQLILQLKDGPKQFVSSTVSTHM